MNTYKIPLGFRFEPTDEELIRAFLWPRVTGLQLPWNGIVEKNLYGADAAPWAALGDAPPESWRRKREGGATKSTIYAFTTLPREGLSKRTARAAGGGTWSAQIGSKEIKNSDTGEIIGYRRMLTFKPSKSDDDVADLGHWNMHEYWLSEDWARASGRPNAGNLVVCKITKTVKEKKKKREVCKKQKSGAEAEDWNDEDLDSLYLDLDSTS